MGFVESVLRQMGFIGLAVQAEGWVSMAMSNRSDDARTEVDLYPKYFELLIYTLFYLCVQPSRHVKGVWRYGGQVTMSNEVIT